MSPPSIVAVVLAGGASRRLGRPKQLLAVEGGSLLAVLAREALASSCDRVVVVLGARASEIRHTLEGLDLTVLVNAGWEEGIASSIRCGVSWADQGGYDAALLMPADQPRLKRAHLERLAVAFRASGACIASRYGGVLGAPALFDRAAFQGLLALRGDTGACKILRGPRAAVAVDWPDGAVDIDTPADLHGLGRP